MSLASRSSHSTVTTIYTFTRDEVLAALHAYGLIPGGPVIDSREQVRITEEAYIRVPGGGDWANVNLCLDESPLVVKVTEESSS